MRHPNDLIRIKLLFIILYHVALLFPICSHFKATQTGGVAEMHNLDLLDYWNNFDSKKRKALIILLRQLVFAKESRLPYVPQKKSSKSDQ